MQPTTKNEAYQMLFDEITSMAEKKNNDYGDNISEAGELGLAVRVRDKTARLKSLVIDGRDRKVEDEKTIDTWMDNANYSLMAILLKRGWWSLPWDENSKNRLDR